MPDLIGILISLLSIYQLMVLAVVFLSWINPDPYNPIVRFLYRVTEPVMAPFRRLLMPLTQQIRIDLSPILVFLAIGFVQRMLNRLRYEGLSPTTIGHGLLDGLFAFVLSVLWLLSFFLIGRIIVDATNANRWNPIVRVIDMVTDPIVLRFRAFRGRSRSFDFAPVAALVAFALAAVVVLSLRNVVFG